jgi:hypothetical protein
MDGLPPPVILWDKVEYSQTMEETRREYPQATAEVSGDVTLPVIKVGQVELKPRLSFKNGSANSVTLLHDSKSALLSNSIAYHDQLFQLLNQKYVVAPVCADKGSRVLSVFWQECTWNIDDLQIRLSTLQGGPNLVLTITYSISTARPTDGL